MSRIGKQPVKLAKDIKVNISENFLVIKFGNNLKQIEIPYNIVVSCADDMIKISFMGSKNEKTANWGSFRQNVNNIILGMTEGFTKKIIFTGTGYKAEVQGDIIRIYLGYSHPIYYKIPESIKAEYDKNANIITLKGSDKKILGNVSSLIKSLRPTEPYNGKGVRFQGEYVLRKETKSKK